MSLRYEYGNILSSNCTYVCCSVGLNPDNLTTHTMRVRHKYPQAFFNYKSRLKEFEEYPDTWNMGSILITDIDKYHKIIMMFAAGSYEALWDALHEIRENVPVGSRIGFEYYEDKELNFDIVRTLIREVLADTHDVEIFRFN